MRLLHAVLFVLSAVVLASLMPTPAEAQVLPTCNANAFPASMSVGIPYTLSCSVSGGTSPYTWSVSAGALPTGMTTNSFSNGAEFNVSGGASTAGTYSFTLLVTDSVGGTGSLSFTVTVSSGTTATGTISLSSISPTTMTEATSTILSVSGANFTSNTIVFFNGNALTTTYLSPTQAYALIPASLAIAGNIPVHVYDATNGTSGTLYLTVSSSASGTITLASISPSSVAAGSAATTVTLYGSGFSSGVLMNVGSLCQVGTSFVSSVQLQATIPASCLTTAGSYSVSVGGSNTVSFTIGGSGTGITTLTSLYPTSLTAGTATTLQLYGTYFTASTQVYFNGTSVATTYQNSSTYLTAYISGSLITSGTLPVHVYDPTYGTSGDLYVTVSGTAASGTITLSSVAPTNLTAGASTTLNVFGTNFTANSIIHFNGNAFGATYVNSTQLYTTIPSSYVVAGNLPVFVTDVSTGTSVTLYVTVSGSTASGSISLASVSPTAMVAGTSNTLNLFGTNFTPNSIIHFNGYTLGAVYVSSTQIYATIPASYVTSGSLPVYVTDSANGTSGIVYVAVSATTSSGIIALSSVSPTTITAGSSTTLYLYGSYFTPSSVVHFNGNSIVPSYASTTQLYATIPSSYLTAGSLAVYVTDPANGTSGTLYVTVSGTASSGSVTLSQLSPSSMTAGVSTTLYITGTNFTTNSVVHFNGNILTPTFVSSTQLYVSIPSLYVTSGTLPVYVSDSTNGTSGIQYVTVSATTASGIITLTSVSPTSLNVGTSSTLYLYGTNFTASTLIHFNNYALAATYVSSMQLYATVPSSYLTAGSLPVYVTDTTNGTSGTLYVTVTGITKLVPSATTLTFAAPTGAKAATQTLTITSSDSQTPIPFTVSASANNGGSWLSITPSSGTTPASFTITANAASLIAGSYLGGINVSPTGSTGSPLYIPVTFTATAPITLNASPSPLNFSATVGQSNPAVQTITLSASDNSAQAFTASASTTSGGNWLTATVSGATTPGTISVSASIANMTAGTYNGSIAVTAAGASNSPVTIPVTLVIANPAPLTSSPASLSFSFQSGGTAPAAQTLNLAAPGGGSGTYNYSITAATSSGGNWLSATPTSGSTPSAVSVSVSPSGLAAGSYTGTLTITSTSAATLTVQVNLTVTAAATLAVSPQSLTFKSAINGSAPSSQTLAVTTTNSVNASYTVTASSTGNWLSATAGGTTPGAITVSVNPGGLAVGQYSGTLSIASPGATNTPQTVQVTLNVVAPPVVGAAPSSLSFYGTGNGATPTPQSITIISTGGSAAFTASASTQNGNWLSVSGSGSTPGIIVVSVNPAGLTAGVTYIGAVTVSVPSGIPTSLTVPVTLTMASQAAVPLQAAPSALRLFYNQGAGTAVEHLLVINTGGGSVTYSVQGQTASCGNWLTVTSLTGTATASVPGVIGLRVDPSGLTAQTCMGSLTITDSNNNTAVVPVYMAISGATQSIVLSQTAMNFVAQSGSSIPPAQTFQVLNAGSASMPWSVTTNTAWLAAAPSTGSAPSLGQAGMPVSVFTSPQGLAPGVYYGSVQVASSGASNGPQTITVSLTVLASGTNPPALVAPAGAILTGANSQTVNITNSGSTPLTYSAIAATDDGQSWLTVSPASGSVAAGSTNTLSLSANVSGMGTGLRHGTLSLVFSDGTVQTVDVQLAISGAASGAKAVRSCGNSDLAVEFLSPQQNFSATAQIGVPLQVLVQDCSGNALNNSNAGVDVLVGPSNTAVRLTYMGSGLWAGVWTPDAPSSVTLTALAAQIGGSVIASGSVSVNGSVAAVTANTPPNVASVVTAGSYLFPGMVAPGSMISIFGSNLTNGQSGFASAPYPSTLAGAKVSVNGSALPLIYASSNQINAVIPLGLAADEREQLIINRDSTQSVPYDLLMADTAPSAFTVSSQGSSHADANFSANTATATAGQTISILMTGLGIVSNPPVDGSPAAGNSLTTATPIVTIGGIPAQVIYSGLAPGEVGVYQVNVVVPDGVPAGDGVPVIISIDNQIANTVTIAVQ